MFDYLIFMSNFFNRFIQLLSLHETQNALQLPMFFFFFSFFYSIRINIFNPIRSIRGIGSNEASQAGTGDVITSRSLDKLKPLYLYYHSVFGHPT